MGRLVSAGARSGSRVVGDVLVGTNASTVTVPIALSSNARRLSVACRIVAPLATNTIYYARPNGDATSANYTYLYSRAASPSAFAAVGGNQPGHHIGQAVNIAGATLFANFAMDVEAGYKRMLSGESMTIEDATGAGSILKRLFDMRDVWTNTAPVITSMDFAATVASQIGVGSRFTIWEWS